MQSINLKKYSQTPPITKTTFKGSTTSISSENNINVNELKDKLFGLKQYSEVMIKNLPEDIKVDMDYVKNLVQKFYKTDNYKYLFDTIMEVFKKDEKDIIPNTVNGYFLGCLEDNNLSPEDRACTSTCLIALPLPQNEEWSYCKDNVVWAVKDQGKFSFNVINRVDDSKKSYIFINNEDEFIGFSATEKKDLSNLGIQIVKILKYSTINNEYKEITKTPVLLKDVKSRDSVDTRKSTMIANKEMNVFGDINISLIIFIGVTIFVLIMIYLYFSYLS